MKDLTKRNLWLILGLLYVTAIVYGSIFYRPPQNLPPSNFDKVQHFLGYFGLSLYFCQLYEKRFTWVVFLASGALGALIEFLQPLTGYRFFEWADMIVNFVGALLGSLLSMKLPNLLKVFEQKLKF